MTSDRKQPLWPWIVALLIGLPVLYVASFGPACWINNRTGVGKGILWWVYRPIHWHISEDRHPYDNLFYRYSKWDTKNGAHLIFWNDGYMWILPAGAPED